MAFLAKFWRFYVFDYIMDQLILIFNYVVCVKRDEQKK